MTIDVIIITYDDVYDVFFPLCAAHVQACRALMIISLLLGLGSMIVALLGLKCIKIGSSTNESKAKLAVVGGILSALSGEFLVHVAINNLLTILCLTNCKLSKYMYVYVLFV